MILTMYYKILTYTYKFRSLFSLIAQVIYFCYNNIYKWRLKHN
jgi:hypothetical protein